MRGKVDLAEATLSNEAAECVVADLSKVRGGELGQKRLVGAGKLLRGFMGQRGVHTHLLLSMRQGGLPFCAGLAAHTRPVSWPAAYALILECSPSGRVQVRGGL